MSWDFLGDPVVKTLRSNAGGTSLIPGQETTCLGVWPKLKKKINWQKKKNGEGNGNPLQYSCLGNPMDRGAWWATVSVGDLKESDPT